jgi:hypothetical protein
VNGRRYSWKILGGWEKNLEGRGKSLGTWGNGLEMWGKAFGVWTMRRPSTYWNNGMVGFEEEVGGPPYGQ